MWKVIPGLAAVGPYDNIGFRIQADHAITATLPKWPSRAPREMGEVTAARSRRGR